MWGQIAAAVAGPLISGIFGGNNKPQEQVTRNEVDYVKMRASAEAAGFNPITALRNGGSSGFSSSTTTLPAVSSGGFIADAIGSGVQAAFAYDPMARARQELDFELGQAQLKNIQQRNDNSLSFLKTPTWSGSQHSTNGQLGGVKPADVGDTKVTNPYNTYEVNPNYKDASAYEDRYGDSEIGQMIIGAATSIADFDWNMAGSPKAKAEMAKKDLRGKDNLFGRIFGKWDDTNSITWAPARAK